MPRNSLVGQVLGGRYRVDEMVGQGGMSAVYKAYDPNLKRVVAIKTIHAHLAADPRFLVRFEEEATAVAQLRHPNIVQVFDYNHDDDLYYMVQEFVAGETLQERLRRLNKAGKRMPLTEAIEITMQTATRPSYAHRRGMIHRDIKPANIMLDLHGQAILMDFGIVKITGGESHTATGAVVGTALYMPPEVIQGEAPDARSDLYSLGVTLYEMVSGRPPFEADSTMTLMMMHVNNAPPDLRGLRPGVPEALIAVIEKDAGQGPRRPLRLDGPLGGGAEAGHGQVWRRPRRQERQRSRSRRRRGAPPVGPLHRRLPASGPADGAVSGGQWPAGPANAGHARAAPARPVPEPAGGAAAEPRRANGRMADRRRWPAGRRRSRAAWRLRTAPKSEPGAVGRRRCVAAGHHRRRAVCPAALARPDGAGPTPTGSRAGHLAHRRRGQAMSPTATSPAGAPLARITGITLDDQQRYVVTYETSGLTAQPSGSHLHFFFDTVPPGQAGTPGSGLWTEYEGSSPFAQIKQSDRPENAGQLCVLVANPDHSVQPNSGTCSAPARRGDGRWHWRTPPACQGRRRPSHRSPS